MPRSIGLVLYPDFQILDACGPITSFEIAGRMDAQGNQIPMPFGADRTLLHFGIDKAIKLQSNFISIDNPTDYLLAIGKTLSGNNYAALRESLRRLSGLSIVVERFAPGKSGHAVRSGTFERCQCPARSLSLGPTSRLMVEA